MPKVYLSPSTQQGNIGYGNYGSEEYRMNQIADSVERHLCAKKDQITIYRNRPDMTLSQIVADSNSKNPDIHVAIHSNATGKPNSTTRGALGFAYKQGTKADQLIRDIYDEVAKLTPTNDLGISYSTSLYELTNTKAPAALIEIGFHDNPDDAQFIMNNIDNYGAAIARGIMKYLNIRYRIDGFKDSKFNHDKLDHFHHFDQNKLDHFDHFDHNKNIQYYENPSKGHKCIRLMILFENEANLKSALILSNRYGAPMLNIRYARRYLDRVNNFIIVGRDIIGIKDSMRIDEGNSIRNLEKVISFINEKGYDLD